MIKLYCAGIHTVYSVAKFDNLTKSHRFAVLCRKMRQDARPKGNVLIQVLFGKAIMTQLKFRGPNILKVCIKNTKRIEVCDVVASDLVCSYKKLYLKNEDNLPEKGTQRMRLQVLTFR